MKRVERSLQSLKYTLDHRHVPVLEVELGESVHSRFHIPSLATVEIIASSVPTPPSLLGAVAVALSSILEREVADYDRLRPVPEEIRYLGTAPKCPGPPHF